MNEQQPKSPGDSGVRNLLAILDEYAYQNDVLTVGQIRTILENKDALRPDEAVARLRQQAGIQRHPYAPDPKYRRFCRHCGYPERELLMHDPKERP